MGRNCTPHCLQVSYPLLCTKSFFFVFFLSTLLWSSFVPKPHPTFNHLQCRKADIAWHFILREHNIIEKCPEITVGVLHIVQLTTRLQSVVAEHAWSGLEGLRWCSCLVTAAQWPWGVSAGGRFRVREAQRMYKVQDGLGITYLLYRSNRNCNNTVNLLRIYL